MKFNRLIIFIGFMFYLFTLKSAPVYHPIDRSSWEKTVDGLSYTEEKPEPVEMDMRAPFQISSDFLRVIGFIVIAALLIFLLLKLFGKGLFSNTKVAKQKSIIKQLEDDPMESDLDRFLREAMENHDYRLAIRIYYIMLLKALHEKNFIIWKKDKTNMDYLSEMRRHNTFTQLETNTYIYEFIWYGERPIAESQFTTVSSSFISLIQQINNSR